MVRIQLMIDKMESLSFTKEAGVFIPHVKRLWLEQMVVARTEKRYLQFAPLEQVIKAINFLVVNTNINQRDKILLYGALKEAFESKDKVIVPLCHFDEERFVIM